MAHRIVGTLALFALTLVSSATTQAQTVGGATLAPPLHTHGRDLIDSKGNVVHLLSVNWYGIDQRDFVVGGLDHQSLAHIAHTIHEMGFNSVRLPWANETFEKDPVVGDYAIKANPELRGKHAMQAMDAVIDSLSREHLMIILDNHMSNADWCCEETDKNGLWYNDQYPETAWLSDWTEIARRYKDNPWVIGADLRNEPRSGATWGGDDSLLDWHAAAERGGAAALKGNRKLLIFVEGIDYSNHMEGVQSLPIHLPVAERLVYSPHSYGIDLKYANYEEMRTSTDLRFGFLYRMKQEIPVWVGEFGSCQVGDCSAWDRTWESWWMRYAEEHKIRDMGFWALNSTQSTTTARGKFGEAETYTVIDPTWSHSIKTDFLDQAKRLLDAN